MNLNDTLNIAITIIFAVLSVIMLLRWYKLKGKVMIADQQWSTMRILFLIIGLLSFLLIATNQENTIIDYARLCATVIAVSIFMMLRDGIGEEGVISGSVLFPWKKVRAWDYEERKNVIAVFFTIIDKDGKKEEHYEKELDFANSDKENVLKFLRNNIGNKYTRMKKKA